MKKEVGYTGAPQSTVVESICSQGLEKNATRWSAHSVDLVMGELLPDVRTFSLRYRVFISTFSAPQNR
jgi:hypothetical protein